MKKKKLLPTHKEKALKISLSGNLTSRAMYSIRKFFDLEIPTELLVNYGRELLKKNVVEGAEFISRFSLQLQFSPEEAILPLIKLRRFDVAINYAEKYTDMCGYVVSNVAERSVGDNPNLALKLIERFSLPLANFPRVLYLKAKSCVWWSVVAGKTEDFAPMLCNNEKRLQKYLCRQLSRRRKTEDLDLCLKYIYQYKFEKEEEFAKFIREYEQKKKQSNEMNNDGNILDEDGLPLIPPPGKLIRKRSKSSDSLADFKKKKNKNKNSLNPSSAKLIRHKKLRGSLSGSISGSEIEGNEYKYSRRSRAQSEKKKSNSKKRKK